MEDIYQPRLRQRPREESKLTLKLWIVKYSLPSWIFFLILFPHSIRTRKENKERAVELMRKGKHSEARQFLQRCVDITHEMALTLIQVCRAMNVDCVVAPYEADAQLAYLNKIGLAEYVITEDSDLILFGCRKIIYKLDMTGKCQLIDSDKLHKAMKCKPDKFKMDKFRLMCILSGCDYVESLPGES